MAENRRGLLGRIAGQGSLAWERSALQAPESFTLTSPAFAPGGTLPERFRGHLLGGNLSPALEWSTPPAAAEELVLLVEDPDAPRATPPVHLLTIGIDPALGAIPEGGLAQPSPLRGVRHGRGALGHRGWFGPMPPRGHGPHDYAFQLFAIDTVLSLPGSFRLADVLAAVAGHVVARARLDGFYENV